MRTLLTWDAKLNISVVTAAAAAGAGAGAKLNEVMLMSDKQGSIIRTRLREGSYIYIFYEQLSPLHIDPLFLFFVSHAAFLSAVQRFL